MDAFLSLLFIFLLLGVVLAPIIFFVGLYYVFSAKKLRHENPELAKVIKLTALKLILFSIIFFMVGLGVCLNINIHE